jgi:hypothetical protein
LIGQVVKRVNAVSKKSNNPPGATSIVVIRAFDDPIVQIFRMIDASPLTNRDKTFNLEAASSYATACNDRMLIEWNDTASSTNQVWVKKSGSDTSGGFDGANTHDEYATSYSNQSSYDLGGEWFKLG